MELFAFVWNEELVRIAGFCMEFWLAWNGLLLLGILRYFECLEFAWNSELLGMLGVCLECLEFAWNSGFALSVCLFV